MAVEWRKWLKNAERRPKSRNRPIWL